ncbi:MAG: hypothetical protein HY912_00490 [Desulfomonile tiedjei]|uniref:N-acetyltransferase domain-containing protein n=1 Tax=Desulfomonile tiedjei TaxID=2358 RepID=A0A9D6UZK5_9BACT|nr:hypothetical protein [Desulfomonile tiedjei]
MNTDKHFKVDFFRPEDAEGITALFRGVYGDGYPIRLFYDPQAIKSANETGEYYSIVARNAAGMVIGVEHLFRSAPFKNLYEAGAGLVSKEYRNQGVNKLLMAFVYDTLVPGNGGIEGTFGESVCNHIYMHKEVMARRHIETSLEVALMPAEAYDAERSATGRVAALGVFRCYKPKPHRIFLPKAYEEVLRFIYSGLDDQREIIVSDAGLPDAGSSELKIQIFDFARVARIAVHRAAADFESRLDELESEALGRNVVVFQIWLKLGQAWVGAVTDRLRDRGYFLGGALPRWFDDDGLLLQKLLCPPDFEGIKLLTDRSHQMLEIIKQDWSRAKSQIA